MRRQDLRAAFLNTTYGLPDERFGPGDTPVHGLSWASGGQRWAVVTAWNPGGQAQPAEHNTQAQEQLRRSWTGRALDGINGEGEWAEPSLMLTDVRLARAIELGRALGQAAILYGVGRRVALVWLERDVVQVERYWVRNAAKSEE